MHQPERIRIFCEEIWRWFSRHKRVLPWRDLKVSDPNTRAYKILVSEIMLQQTQVPRVIDMYKKFIRRFPDIKALSEASDSEIIIAWRGMGYNSRALHLRDAAWTIQSEYGGRLPEDSSSLKALKGIGDYTAAAIRNFAFNIPTPCLDTNIRRILHRTFVGPENPDGTWKWNDRQLLELAAKVLGVALTPSPPAPLPTGEGSAKRGVRVMQRISADWHSALMDFGSLVCTKTNPKWELYPPKLKSITKAYGKAINRTKKLNNAEPGRMIEGRFVPNRIIRGRIVDHLRDQKEGGSLPSIGKIVASDWNRAVHEAWLRNILGKLKRDRLVVRRGRRLLLPW
ncbi:MAG: hypothetical protein WC840_04345 [Candidatus Peribacteraceae bacterium]